MRVLGIIAEYNPFHNGHLYHIQQSKRISKCDYVIAIMSGDFVQRGEPALVDKHIRTRMALLNGVDLVLELPVCDVLMSAEFFAAAAINIMCSTKIINAISFGSEIGDIEPLVSLAKFLDDSKFDFRNCIEHSYPLAVYNFVKQHYKYAELLKYPNNILGLEYIKALRRNNSDIEVFTMKRQIAQHNENELSNNKISSATAIRNAVLKYDISNYIPHNCFELLRCESYSQFDNLSGIWHYNIDNHKKYMSPDLYNRLRKASSCNAFFISDIIKQTVSKNYIAGAIRRAMLRSILGISVSEYPKQNYIRVLGFKNSAAFLLKHININFVTSVKQLPDEDLKREVNFANVYDISCMRKQNELSQPLVIIRD